MNIQAGAGGPRTNETLARALSAAVDPGVVLRRIVDQAMVLVPMAEGAVVEIVRDGSLHYVCTAGTLTDHEGLRLPTDGSLSGLAVTEQKIMRCDDSGSDPRVDREACRRVGAISMVCVPLAHSLGMRGVLKVTSSEPSAFTARDVEVLSRLSEFISAAVASAADASRIVKSLVRPDGAAVPTDEEGIAEFVANVMQPGLVADTESRRRIEEMLVSRQFEILLQPIIVLSTGEVFGVEALARFRGVPYRPPDVWFADAHRAGLGPALELTTLAAAVALAPRLDPSVRLAVNVGPLTIDSPQLPALIDQAGPSRVVVELTEHLRVEDYPRLNRTLQSLRRRGAILAIDDTGAGISSLTHILKLAPDIIKLDREITSGIDIDPVRRALATALLTFAAESGAMVVAEGIEMPSELEVLRDLGAEYGQGFHLGRPAPIVDLPVGSLRR